MKVWRTFREDYLLQLVRLDGSGGRAGDRCSLCGEDSSLAEFRCHDDECVGIGIVCQSCICASHQHLPLHWVEVCLLYLPLRTMLTPFSSNGQDRTSATFL